MKKIIAFLFVIVLFGCDQQESKEKQQIACQSLNDVVWSNKQQTIQKYKDCIGKIKGNSSWSYEQIDSMLYLSYIYLTDDTYHDIKKANKLLSIAKNAMWQDCEGYHGHYDNFCYFNTNVKQKWQQEPSDIIPKVIDNFDDAIIIYQMSLPCVYTDMIIENEQALQIMDAWFGSSRDIDIPSLCDNDTFATDIVINVNEMVELKSYDYLSRLNKEPGTEGTIRFGFQRSKYHDLIHMLTYPKTFFKTDDFNQVHIEQVGFDGENKKFFAPTIEKEIYKHQDLKRAYTNLQNLIKQHYISFLKMNNQDATKYARMTAVMIILQDIFMV